jgi:hypothetical protein
MSTQEKSTQEMSTQGMSFPALGIISVNPLHAVLNSNKAQRNVEYALPLFHFFSGLCVKCDFAPTQSGKESQRMQSQMWKQESVQKRDCTYST